jgi:hypothetical protein
MTGRRDDVLIVTSLNISDVICDISSHSMTFWTFAPNSARYVLLVASFPQWRWLQCYRNGTTHLSLVFLMCFSSPSFVDSLFVAVLIQEIDNDCWCLVLPVVIVLLHIFHDQNSTWFPSPGSVFCATNHTCISIIVPFSIYNVYFIYNHFFLFIWSFIYITCI